MNQDDNERNELDFNKKNREDFEKLMDESSTNKENYWDINNPVVKGLLLLIGLVILVGAAYFIIKYINR